jgi:hypothetical protein
MTGAIDIARPVTLNIAIWWKMPASFEESPLVAIDMVRIFTPENLAALFCRFRGSKLGALLTGVLPSGAHAPEADELQRHR